MIATALAPSSRLSSHLRVGCSTGMFGTLRGQWQNLVDEADTIALRAIELAALSEADRLRQLHISSLDDDQHHVPLTREDEELFGPLLDRCRDVPWILEAPPRTA